MARQKLGRRAHAGARPVSPAIISGIGIGTPIIRSSRVVRANPRGRQCPAPPRARHRAARGHSIIRPAGLFSTYALALAPRLAGRGPPAPCPVWRGRAGRRRLPNRPAARAAD